MEQPFYVGQKVVRTGNSNIFYKKGETYTVGEMLQCPECKEWHVGCMEFPVKLGRGINTCSCSYNIPYVGSYRTGYAIYFAPIQPAYVDISAELARDAVAETSDVVKKVETVNN